MTTGLAFLIGVVIAVLSIVAARRLAVAKDRLPGPWGLAALLAGPVVVVVLLFVPRTREKSPAPTP